LGYDYQDFDHQMCSWEVADYDEAVKSRGLELEARDNRCWLENIRLTPRKDE
jgi:hypothetical protein